jgi:hypothetical protein
VAAAAAAAARRREFGLVLPAGLAADGVVEGMAEREAVGAVGGRRNGGAGAGAGGAA